MFPSSWGIVLLVMIALAIPVHGEERTRGSPIPAGASGSERILTEFTEAEFLQLVPRQSPRSGQRCPVEPRPRSRQTHWEWNPHRPNEIRWGAYAFPGGAPACKTELVAVLSGKTVEIPYVETPSGRSYVQAQIDYCKRTELLRCLDTLARDYRSTRDERFARRVAVAMDAWAGYLPDYFMTSGKNGLSLVSPAQAQALAWDVQRASDHNGLAHEWTDVEVRAMEAIRDSKALLGLSLERGYDVWAHILKDYFGNEGDFLTRCVPVETAIRTNLSWPFEVLAQVSILADRPDYIVWLDRYLAQTIAVNFLADGMFPESFTYHGMYAGENLRIAQAVARYFALHPADTPALRQVEARVAGYQRAFSRSAAIHRTVALPNGDLPPFDDTDFGGASARDTTRSGLLPAYGHAMLGAGAGRDQTQVNVHFNDRYNHIHGGVLALSLYAFGRELLGANRYSHGIGRYFTTRTMAYNTVTIDRTTQERGNVGMPGNGGHLFTGGDLLAYEPGLAGIALAAIDGRRAYLTIGGCRYERMVVLNTTDPDHPYLIDAFRVGGGHIHDYLLHGAIGFPQQAQASFPLEPIAREFPLLEPGERWLESRGDDGGFSWYGAFRDMSSGRSPGRWQVTFRGNAGEGGICIHVADDAGCQAYLGRSPVGRRHAVPVEPPTIFSDWRPVLMMRRKAPAGQTLQSLFITVIEPLKGASAITEVERLPMMTRNDDSAALRIAFADGREDRCLISFSDPAYVVAAADGILSLQGRFGLVSRRGGAASSWLISGTRLRHGDRSIDVPDGIPSGKVIAVMRRCTGAPVDAFVTDAVLPEGEAWRGRWLSLLFAPCRVAPDEGGSFPLGTREQTGIRQMYQIERVIRREGRTWICLADDPALIMAGGTVIEACRPHRTFSGPCQFSIELSSHHP